MTQVLVILLALLIGVIAGLRALTAPAVVAWGAFLGWIDVDGKWSEWVAHPITVTVLTIFLLIELVTDQLPKTPSRKTTPQFLTRLIMGAFAGRGHRQRVLPHLQRHRRRNRRRRAGHNGRCSGPAASVRRQRWQGPAGCIPGGRHRRWRWVPCRVPRQPRLNRLPWQRSSTRSSSAQGRPGPPLAGRLTEAGQTVAVIERKLAGGTCVNYGCIPTKTLVASAHAAHLARRGADYGIGTGDITVDMAKVKARKDKVSGDDRRGLESWLQGMKGCTFIRGHARFESPHTIRVDDRLLEADKIFLNVGGRAVAPDMPGLADIDYMTNVGILELDTVPEHLVDHRRQLHRPGVRPDVPPVRRPSDGDRKGPRLTPREDEDVSATIKEILEGEGIDIVVDATAIQFTKRDSGFRLCRPRAPSRSSALIC